MSRADHNTSGRCLCGACAVEGRGDVTRVAACHCSQCRRQNGGGALYSVQFKDGISFNGDQLRWISVSDWGERGFCVDCGSTIGWREKANPVETASVSAGLFDNFKVRVQEHIFVDSGPEYTVIPDDAPHRTKSQAIATFASSDESKNDD